MGLVKAASVTLGMQALMSDMGKSLKVEAHTDATSAKAIATRKGLGRVRHMDVTLLWLQQRVAKAVEFLRHSNPGTEQNTRAGSNHWHNKTCAATPT